MTMQSYNANCNYANILQLFLKKNLGGDVRRYGLRGLGFVVCCLGFVVCNPSRVDFSFCWEPRGGLRPPRG